MLKMKISLYAITILCLFTASTPLAFGDMGAEGLMLLFYIIIIVPLVIGIGIWYGIKSKNKPVMIMIAVSPLIFLWFIFLLRGS